MLEVARLKFITLWESFNLVGRLNVVFDDGESYTRLLSLCTDGRRKCAWDGLLAPTRIQILASTAGLLYIRRNRPVIVFTYWQRNVANEPPHMAIPTAPEVVHPCNAAMLPTPCFSPIRPRDETIHQITLVSTLPTGRPANPTQPSTTPFLAASELTLSPPR